MATSHPLRESLEAVRRDLNAPTLESFLNMARWVAATMVFVGHLRNPLFLGYGDVPLSNRTLAVQAWYFLTGWHAEAVTVFFVLSGLLVAGAGMARANAGIFDPGGFAIDRATRLFLPFIPAVLIGYLLDLAGSRIFADVGFWNAAQPMIAQKVSSPPFASLLGVDVLLGNLLMLQSYVVPPLGSNQPLWSISAEFWFYAIFPLLVFAWLPSRSKAVRLLAFVCVAAVCTLLGVNFLVLLGLWCIGAAIACVPGRRIGPPGLAGLLFLGMLIVARAANSFFDANELYRELKNYAVALTFAYLVVCLRGRRYAWLEHLAPVNSFLAGFSFSLYLLHFPVMLFVLAVLHATGSFDAIASGFDPTDPRGLATYILTIAIVMTLAWLFSLGTERKTEGLRRLLKRRFIPSPCPPSPKALR